MIAATGLGTRDFCMALHSEHHTALEASSMIGSGLDIGTRGTVEVVPMMVSLMPDDFHDLEDNRNEMVAEEAPPLVLISAKQGWPMMELGVGSCCCHHVLMPEMVLETPHVVLISPAQGRPMVELVLWSCHLDWVGTTRLQSDVDKHDAQIAREALKV